MILFFGGRSSRGKDLTGTTPHSMEIKPLDPKVTQQMQGRVWRNTQVMYTPEEKKMAQAIIDMMADRQRVIDRIVTHGDARNLYLKENMPRRFGDHLDLTLLPYKDTALAQVISLFGWNWSNDVHDIANAILNDKPIVDLKGRVNQIVRSMDIERDIEKQKNE